MRRGRSAAILISAAIAATAATQTSAAAPAKPVAASPAPSLPAPAVTLTVTPGTGGGPWKLTIQNNGEVPVRLAADPRLLVLELTPATNAASATNTTNTTGATKSKTKAGREPATLKCALPDDARPSTDDGFELVVPAKRSYSHSFDPLFYCFGARERAALVAGTSVKARFGWPTPQRAKTAKAVALSPPFAVSPVGAAIGQVAPAKEIESASLTLADAATIASASASASGSSSAGESDASGMDLTLPDAVDVARGVDISTTVTLTNRSDRAVSLFLRPQAILFTVSGPSGTVSCGTPPAVEAPIRELYATLGSKAKAQQTVLVNAVCPPDTFDEPGVYRVVPRIDTTGASARKLGLKTWDGRASGKVPMLLRVRTPRRASSSASRNKPTLD